MAGGASGRWGSTLGLEGMWSQRTWGTLTWAQQDYRVRGPLEEARVLSVMPVLLLKKSGPGRQYFFKGKSRPSMGCKIRLFRSWRRHPFIWGPWIYPKCPDNQRGRETWGGPFLPSVQDKEKTHSVPQKIVLLHPMLDCKGISHWSYFK